MPNTQFSCVVFSAFSREPTPNTHFCGWKQTFLEVFFYKMTRNSVQVLTYLDKNRIHVNMVASLMWWNPNDDEWWVWFRLHHQGKFFRFFLYFRFLDQRIGILSHEHNNSGLKQTFIDTFFYEITWNVGKVMTHFIHIWKKIYSKSCAFSTFSEITQLCFRQRILKYYIRKVRPFLLVFGLEN